MKHCCTLFLGVIACALSMAQAQSSTVLAEDRHDFVSSAPLTLRQALNMARTGNPRLRESSAAVEQAQAGVKTARAYANPNLEIYEGQQYARPIATPGVPGLLQHYAAYQPIEIPKERAARLRAARLGTEASRFAGQGVALGVVADTKRAFYNALKRREEIAHARENLSLVEDLRRRVAVEVNVGEKGGLELTRATAELARAQFAVHGAELEYAQAVAKLRAAIAAAPDDKLEPVGELEPRFVLAPLQELRVLVLNAHPALKESVKQREAAEASLDGERALRIPRPTAFAEFENQPDLRYWRAGISVALPLFDRRRGQIDAAQAQVNRADAVRQGRVLELTAALEQAYEQYQLADQQATSLESGSLRAAESAVQGAQAAYRFGERGLVDVLDAQRVLQNVRGDLLNARYARQSAAVDLEELGAVVADSGATP